MREYVFSVPDANQPIAGDTAMYYPDERDEPMMVGEEIVRCRDCEHLGCYKPFDAKTGKPSEKVTIYICNGQFWNVDGTSEVEPDGFCKWGERRSE